MPPTWNNGILEQWNNGTLWRDLRETFYCDTLLQKWNPSNRSTLNQVCQGQNA